ncbi:hypothetical protein [Teredinibacter purpureus]|uniref:hypothetical protein n=1 Tax=Teredinibacter purpureus TaxID=2731756 RepID=UPI0005F815C7|nr:hypothetical protein [Teredinibacter purpureus]
MFHSESLGKETELVSIGNQQLISDIAEMVSLVESSQVVGFRQGGDLWVIHPSAKAKSFWQATHYDVEKMSMMDDCLQPNIRSVLLFSGLVLSKPIVVMDPMETENILINSSANHYRAS